MQPLVRALSLVLVLAATSHAVADALPVVSLIDIGVREPSAGTIVQPLKATNPPFLSWSDLVQTLGPAPAIAPTLAANGTFTWNPAGSLASGNITYQWAASVRNAAGSIPPSPAFQVTVIPEPTTSLMLLVGVVALQIRRRVR